MSPRLAGDDFGVHLALWVGSYIECDPLSQKGYKVAGKITTSMEKTIHHLGVINFTNSLFLMCSHCRPSILPFSDWSQPYFDL